MMGVRLCSIDVVLFSVVGVGEERVRGRGGGTEREKQRERDGGERCQREVERLEGCCCCRRKRKGRSCGYVAVDIERQERLTEMRSKGEDEGGDVCDCGVD